MKQYECCFIRGDCSDINSINEGDNEFGSVCLFLFVCFLLCEQGELKVTDGFRWNFMGLTD